ncbi:uncharacterized protein PgNI_04022, partial [Pyricularia grisea]|uniref:Uncharacterized protein n=1 Tax=Pyricularia grisea TaxID=148305 RepID=A0A6P8BBF5_PYRGI
PSKLSRVAPDGHPISQPFVPFQSWCGVSLFANGGRTSPDWLAPSRGREPRGTVELSRKTPRAFRLVRGCLPAKRQGKLRQGSASQSPELVITMYLTGLLSPIKSSNFSRTGDADGGNSNGSKWIFRRSKLVKLLRGCLRLLPIRKLHCCGTGKVAHDQFFAKFFDRSGERDPVS